MQGDIIGIVDKDSTVVARYSYDAWGKVRSVKNSNNDEITSESHIAIINPFRYRGYYFDQGTNLYYLQSRYYDAEIGRFVNGDNVKYLGLSEEIIGYNLYSYCENSVCNKLDVGGNISLGLRDLKNDWAGREILKQYLRGDGKARTYSSEKWTKYMIKAKMCSCQPSNHKYNSKQTLQTYINDFVKKYILTRKNSILFYVSRRYKVQTKAAITNGEGIIGYNYLHGTNGGLSLNINATYVKREILSKRRAILVSIECTWNDIIDHNNKYPTDIYKASLAKKIPFANPTDYKIKIIWNQYMRILL